MTINDLSWAKTGLTKIQHLLLDKTNRLIIQKIYVTIEQKKLLEHFLRSDITMVDEEKRSYSRFPAILHIEYGKDAMRFSKSRSLNESSGGLFIKTEYPLETGERIFVSIPIPNVDDPILVECEVVWNRKKRDAKGRLVGMGVKFIDLSEHDQEILNALFKGGG